MEIPRNNGKCCLGYRAKDRLCCNVRPCVHLAVPKAKGRRSTRTPSTAAVRSTTVRRSGGWRRDPRGASGRGGQPRGRLRGVHRTARRRGQAMWSFDVPGLHNPPQDQARLPDQHHRTSGPLGPRPDPFGGTARSEWRPTPKRRPRSRGKSDPPPLRRACLGRCPAAAGLAQTARRRRVWMDPVVALDLDGRGQLDPLSLGLVVVYVRFAVLEYRRYCRARGVLR